MQMYLRGVGLFVDLLDVASVSQGLMLSGYLRLEYLVVSVNSWRLSTALECLSHRKRHKHNQMPKPRVSCAHLHLQRPATYTAAFPRVRQLMTVPNLVAPSATLDLKLHWNEMKLEMFSRWHYSTCQVTITPVHWIWRILRIQIIPNQFFCRIISIKCFQIGAYLATQTPILMHCICDRLLTCICISNPPPPKNMTPDILHNLHFNSSYLNYIYLIMLPHVRIWVLPPPLTI